jgi:hypothetical protein
MLGLIHKAGKKAALQAGAAFTIKSYDDQKEAMPF